MSGPAPPLPTGLSGEVHPWRLDPGLWPTVLDTVAGMGFRTVCAYVPWIAHEDESGRFDFTGPRDIVRFCELAAERGLAVVTRIGPNSCAEQETSGWPHRIAHDPECQARRPDGRPYLLVSATHHFFPPSYAAPKVLAETARWYDAIVPLLAPLQAPDGPIVACQIDNEMGYHFQPHPYALDYHPAAIEQYRAWLLERYGTLDAINAAYGTSFTAVEPPRDGTEGPELRRLDWVAWKEEHLRRSLATLAGMARERGLRVPLVHNDYPRLETPMDAGALEASGAVDVAALDVYTTKEGARFARDVVRHAAGSSRHPWLMEAGAGWLTLPWLLPMAASPEDSSYVTMRAIASGALAANVYMLVERDRWYASPVSRSGQAREPFASFYRRFNALLDDIDLPSLRRRAPVLLVENRTEGRRAAAREILGESVPCFAQLYPLDRRLCEPDDPGRDELNRWASGLAAVLERAGVDHDRCSSESMPQLDRYELVLCPAFDAFDPAAWDRLAGAPRAAVGPRVPSLDASLRPRAFDAAGIEVLGSPDDAAALLPAPAFTASDPSVGLHLWEGGGREVLFAFNDSPEPVEAKLTFTGEATLRGRWEPGTVGGASGAAFSLGPWGVQVWEVER